MRVEELDYDLPEELIAQVPLEDRSASKLLCLSRATGAIEHGHFRDLPSLLEPGDMLVANNTRVTALRCQAVRPTGGKVEAFLLHEPSPGEFIAMLRPAKRCGQGSVLHLGELKAEIIAVEAGGLRRLRFEPIPGWREQLAQNGQVPLPPYIHAALANAERYQTVYSQHGGSAAAPTAGLHFTPALREELRAKGIGWAEITLHVGLDTFQPVKTELVEEHPIHGERCEISPQAAEAISACPGRLIAVGTTSVRTLESLAIRKGEVRAGNMETRLFITPGYEFQVVQGIVTNFHMPRTTLIALVAAFAGLKQIQAAYSAAKSTPYRFLSFGDSMLIL